MTPAPKNNPKKRFTKTDLAAMLIHIDQKLDILGTHLNWLDQSIINVARNQIVGDESLRVEFRAELAATERRLEQKIDEVISTMTDFIHLSSAKYDNHETRITKLEKAPAGHA